MTVSRSPRIDRPVQLQMLANAARLQAHHLGQTFLELRLVDFARVVQIDIERHRIGNADRIGNLNCAALRQPRRHHILRQIARAISGRAVDLRRILAGERAAAVRRRAAIRVDDNLAPRQPRVAVRTADDEAPCRVHEQPVVRTHPAGRHRCFRYRASRSRGCRADRARRHAASTRRSSSRAPACRFHIAT